MAENELDWQIAVFCQNERRSIADCLASISSAARHRNALITVMINGSTDGSEDIARSVAMKTETPIRIYRIPHADKSNAINNFFHDRKIRLDAAIYFGVDAYVRICPESLEAIARSLAQHPSAVAATGIATTGRSLPKESQRTVQSGASLRGGLYALRRSFVEKMVAGGIRLPIGFYRGDGLLGAMAAFNLDSLNQSWVDERLITEPVARFATQPLSPFRLQDIRRQLRRKVRQMQGTLENAAIKKIVKRDGFSALPEFADDLVRDYLATNSAPQPALLDRPFLAIALRQSRKRSRPAPDSLRPVRVV